MDVGRGKAPAYMGSAQIRYQGLLVGLFFLLHWIATQRWMTAVMLRGEEEGRAGRLGETERWRKDGGKMEERWRKDGGKMDRGRLCVVCHVCFHEPRQTQYLTDETHTHTHSHTYIYSYTHILYAHTNAHTPTQSDTHKHTDRWLKGEDAIIETASINKLTCC